MGIGKRIVNYLDLQEIGGDGATWVVIQVGRIKRICALITGEC